MKTKLFLTVLAIAATMMVVNAHETGNKTTDAKQAEQTKCSGFVDSNNNGVCDNFENSKSDTSVQNSGCRMMGKGNGQMNMKRNRNGQGMSKGQGNCKSFTDTDNNGICDMYEARHKSKV